MTISITQPTGARKAKRPVEDRVLALEELLVTEGERVTTVSAILVRTDLIYRLTDEIGQESRERFGRNAFARLNLANARLNLFASPRRRGYQPNILASTRSGTLRLARDGDGLAVEFDLERDRHPASAVADAFRSGNLLELGMSMQVLREKTGPLAIVRTMTEVRVLSLFIPFEGATVTRA